MEEIFTSSAEREVKLEFEGKEIVLRVRNLSWSEKNQILSQCFVYQPSGNVQFNFDKYMKESLCKIIVNAPWGKTDHILLNRIKPEFGAKLEALVPKAFVEGATSDFFVKE